MNLINESLILKFQKGSPILFDDVCAIFPSKLGEIVDIGYDNYQLYLSLLTNGKPVLEETHPLTKIIEGMTDFQYLLASTEISEELKIQIKNAFRFFTHDEVTFLLDSSEIIIGPLTEHHVINEENFYNFRSILRAMAFLEDDNIQISVDDDSKVKSIKEKILQSRKKLERAKQKQNNNNDSSTNLSLSDLIGSVCVNNCGLNMDNIWNITYYAFNDQLKRMGWRDQFDINHRAALAGAKIKKQQLEHWIKSISSK